eukprot:m.39604 g.39604  ORF g.39604 m.39604 type:complete len:89 (+) comp16645_c0_seq2:237-503(+)
MLFFGDRVFSSLQMATPAWFTQARANQYTWMAGIYFLGNTLAQNLMHTGAFEVYVDDTQVWSKLETGRLPSWPELVGALKDHGIGNQS